MSRKFIKVVSAVGNQMSIMVDAIVFWRESGDSEREKNPRAKSVVFFKPPQSKRDDFIYLKNTYGEINRLIDEVAQEEDAELPERMMEL